MSVQCGAVGQTARQGILRDDNFGGGVTANGTIIGGSFGAQYGRRTGGGFRGSFGGGGASSKCECEM